MAYAFSGSVMFQYCNVVFLIGAAWLPLAVLAADRLLTRRRWIDLPITAMVWAMMVLGRRSAVRLSRRAAGRLAGVSSIGSMETRSQDADLFWSIGRLAMVGSLALG
jgi:hypothetical protein